MEKTIHISSLQELLSISKTSQLSAQSILSRRICTDKDGWSNLDYPSDLKEELCHLIVDVLGGQTKTKTRLFNRLRHGSPLRHWGLDRTVLIERDGKPRFYYIAGQDMSAELPMIRKQLLAS